MLPNHKSIDGVTVDLLGSLEDSSLIVVVGRSNYKKSSESLDSLVKDLHAAGRSVLWFESRSTQTSKLLDSKFQHICGSTFSDWCSANQFIGNPLRKLIKAAMLLKHPRRWDYFYGIARNQNKRLAESLRRLIRQLPARQIYLFS